MSQPELHEIVVNCNCGSSFKTRSSASLEELRVEICSKCHPFYTKEQKVIDTEGTITAFNRRYRKKSNS